MRRKISEKELLKVANKVRKNVHATTIKQIKAGNKAGDLVGKVQQHIEKSKLDDFLCLKETILIVESFLERENGLLFIRDDDETAGKLAADLFHRGVNNILRTMVKQDVLDCSFDVTTNDFHFNVKE